MMDLCDEIEWISFGWICHEDLTEVWIFLWIGLNLVWISVDGSDGVDHYKLWICHLD